MSKKAEMRDKEESTFASTCPNCERSRIFSVITEKASIAYEDPIVFMFAICQTCNAPALFSTYFYPTDDDYKPLFEQLKRLWPPETRDIHFKLPNTVKDSYEEAVKCEQAQAWTACVVMVGRTLEYIVKEFKKNVRNMAEGLQFMKDEGIVSKEIYEWGNELRILRNYGAHATTEEIKKADAREALDFLQAILEILYHLRPKFEKMKERR